MRILRTLRGILAAQLTWAVAWLPFSLIPIGLAILSGASPTPRVLGIVLLNQALVGAINGGVFATVLAIAGRRKTFESLSMPWIAACGAVGGALFPFGVRTLLLTSLGVHQPVTTLVTTLVTNALLGAGCAALSLKIARRAPVLRSGSDPDVPAIDAGGEPSAIHVAKPKALATSR